MRTTINPTSIQEIIYTDNQSPISISLGDGYYYGLSFFETILVTHMPIFLRAHLDRLNSSLSQFNIGVYITEDLVNQLIQEHNIRHKALKIHVSDSNIVVSIRDLPYDDTFYEKGLKLTISPIIRSSYSHLVRHKSSNYGDMILSLRQAKKQGYDDCIYFNEQGYVCETSIANLFIIKDGTLYTPSIDNGLLAGIIRAYILEHYPVIETKLTIDDLLFADGVFVSNSLMGMTYVSTIEFDKKIIAKNRLVQMEDLIPNQGHYKRHPLFDQVVNDYLQLVE